MNDIGFHGLLTNNAFPSLTFVESGTPQDLLQRFEGVDTRMSQDETALRDLSVALIGTDVLENETSWTSWLTSHVASWVADSLFSAGRLSEILSHACAYAREYTLPSYHMIPSTALSHDVTDMGVYCGHASRNIRNRFVYQRFRYEPHIGSILIVPSGDYKVTDFSCVHYNDFELRHLSSFLLGSGVGRQGTFSIKQIDSYYAGGDASTSFPDDPLAVSSTTELLSITQNLAHFKVPVKIDGVLAIGQIPDVAQRLKKMHHHVNTDHTYHYTQKRINNHVHKNRYYNFETLSNHVYAPVVNKEYNSYRTVPSVIETNLHYYIQKRSVLWSDVLGKPDHNLYSLIGHTHAEYSPLLHTHPEYALTTHTHDTYTQAQIQSFLTYKQNYAVNNVRWLA